MFDYSKLRGRIKEIFGTQDAFADAVGIGRVSLSKRRAESKAVETPEVILSEQEGLAPSQIMPVRLAIIFFTE